MKDLEGAVKILAEMLKSVEQNDEFIGTIASLSKKVHDALIAKGFTSEQAISIMTAIARK
jgi:SOS response regulatory protein OraA/RecX